MEYNSTNYSIDNLKPASNIPSQTAAAINDPNKSAQREEMKKTDKYKRHNILADLLGVDVMGVQ